MIEGFLMLGGVLVFLFIIFIWNSLKNNKRKWKVRKGDNDTREYVEMDQSGAWRHVSFECEPYAKNVPRHALYIRKDWKDYPDWAQLRKEEILERVKSVLKEPEYTIIERE
jgi:hypothetical protein